MLIALFCNNTMVVAITSRHGEFLDKFVTASFCTQIEQGMKRLCVNHGKVNKPAVRSMGDIDNFSTAPLSCEIFVTSTGPCKYHCVYKVQG